MARLYLSPPDVGDDDRKRLLAALDSGWVAPAGPDLDAFESELEEIAGRTAVALISGTAALHLALILAGVEAGDRVLVSDLTFAASANVVRYLGAQPVFVDSDDHSWNLDPALLEEELVGARRQGERYKALISVDLFGQCADYGSIEDLCAEHGVTLIEDAAEAIGALYRGRPAGSFGAAAVYSFNGNKMITTSNGGALLTDRPDWAARARFLANQARDPAPHYQHSELGFNYRLSNLLAGLGRAQLADLTRRVEVRREHNSAYRAGLADVAGVEFMPEAAGCRSTFWLTALTIDPERAGCSREDLRLRLEDHNIEARPVWKPMHLQPLYADCRVIGGTVSARLFERGLCLPSGSSLTESDRSKVIDIMRDILDTSGYR